MRSVKKKLKTVALCNDEVDTCALIQLAVEQVDYVVSHTYHLLKLIFLKQWGHPVADLNSILGGSPTGLEDNDLEKMINLVILRICGKESRKQRDSLCGISIATLEQHCADYVGAFVDLAKVPKALSQILQFKCQEISKNIMVATKENIIGQVKRVCRRAGVDCRPWVFRNKYLVENFF